jgi:hypothetical protein
MRHFFPRHAIEWTLHEPRALRRLSLSLVAMAVLAGVIVHACRWVVFAYGPGRHLWFALSGVLLGLVLLLGLATAHLGNYPIAQWVWRAPLFACVESATEAVISVALIAAGVERLGTQYAHWHDLPSIARSILLARIALLVVFALVLAGVVQMVRFFLLKHEHRDTTAVAIHEDHVRQVHHTDHVD